MLEFPQPLAPSVSEKTILVEDFTAQAPLPPSSTESLPREQHADGHSQLVYGRKQKEEEKKPTLGPEQ
uniref:Uncharacterized protein n=1 Tax=Moniliophthora roreri TaxID=221103 RepID=A0A0W0FP01_MONRR